MKNSNKSLKSLCWGTSVLLAGLVALPAFAEDEINVEQIRKELHQAAATGANDATTGKDFALSDKEIAAENARLDAEEAELLKKLSSPEAQALMKDVAAGKTEAIPTAASLEKDPTLAASETGIAPAAMTARAETQLSGTVKVESEEIPLVRKVDSTGSAASADAKASLKSGSERLLPPESDESLKVKTLTVTKNDKMLKAEPEVKTIKATAADSSDASLKGLNAQLAALRKTNMELSTKLQRSDATVSDLTKQLENAKNRLMLAETEVERLAGAIDVRNRSAAARIGGTGGASGGGQMQQQAQPNIAPVVQRVQPRPSDDTPVATVVSEKANLRTGPGADNSPLMSVTRGTRLVVETKQGDWYRVISPTGTRAWVSSDVVAFGPTSQSSPTRTVRIRGFDGSLESDNSMPGKSAQ